LRFERGAEARPEIGEDERAGQDADRCRRHVRQEPHPEQRRAEIDEPEREERHQAEEEKVAEAFLLEAGAQLLRARTCTLGEKIAERRSGDEKNDGGAGRRCRPGERRADDSAEHEAARHGERARARKGDGHGSGIDDEIGCRRSDRVAGDEAQKRILGAAE
jgi:hypothetical protein